MKHPPLFTGTATALVTPFSGGKIDYHALSRLIEYQLEGGVSTLVLCGTTGESATLSPAEKAAIFSFAVRQYGTDATILAGCGSADTENAALLCRMAEASGAGGILSVTPYYNKPTPEGIFRHYEALCEATSLPILVYSVPARTGVGISPALWTRLCTLPNIRGLKDAGGNLAVSARLLAAGDAPLYSGNDDSVLPLLSLGGLGCISVLSNLAPARMQGLCQAFFDGKTANAAEIQLSLLPLCDALFWETNPIPVKWALSRLGFCKPLWRLPLVEPTEECKKKIETALETAGLL